MNFLLIFRYVILIFLNFSFLYFGCLFGVEFMFILIFNEFIFNEGLICIEILVDIMLIVVF